MMTKKEQRHSKLLAELIAVPDQQFAAIEVLGIELDSRKVKAGDLFLACSGHALDGREFIDQAISLGAVAVLVEQGPQWLASSIRDNVPLIVIDNLSTQISAIAGEFFNHPSLSLPVIGVTGTNGKTSCTQLMMQLFNRQKVSCGVIGTLGMGVDGHFDQGQNTTPDAVSIQHFLAQCCDKRIPVVAMEASSHGLEQGRVAALQFELALLTNLSRDHLDYHGNMQTYAEAKSLLFQQRGLKKAVINLDDAFADSLATVVADDVDVLRYSVKAAHDNADLWLENITYHAEGVNAQLHSPWGQFNLSSPLLGEFNLSNVIAVIACFGALGYPVTTTINELVDIAVIPGRMERVSTATDADITVVVDYAHTPDALEKALQAMRQHSIGDVWCVFGCGGDRDQGKRPQMGEVVQRFADHVVVTSDNPRSESASDIINEILGGVDRPTLVEEDRGIAIDSVIANAKPGDAVLIAGKGHEDYQLIGEQRLSFSDIKQARLALAKRMRNTDGGTL